MKAIQRVFEAALSLIASFAALVLACPSGAQFGDQDTINGLDAAADLRNYQYRVVRMASALTVDVASNAVSAAAAQMPIGVLQNNPNTGEAATVAYQGLSKVVGGGTVTAGALITTNSSGQVVDAASGDITIGRAMQTLATAGHVGTALLLPPVRAASVA